MRSIPQFAFHKTKYGDELLIDVVNLNQIKQYVPASQIHTLTYYDITIITEGSGFFCIDDKKYAVNPKDVIFSIPGEIRTWDTDKIKNGYALIFEEEFLLSFFNDREFIQKLSFFSMNRLSTKMSLNDIFFKKIVSLITNIREEIHAEKRKDTHILRALLYETLMLFQREFILVEQDMPLPDKISGWHVNNFIRLVNAEFTSQQSINYYASQLCLTPNYLNEIVKRTIGINAKQYILNKVTLEAKKLLIYTSLSVKQISDRLNFSSSSYFTRFFHKQTDSTPLQYRHSERTKLW